MTSAVVLDTTNALMQQGKRDTPHNNERPRTGPPGSNVADVLNNTVRLSGNADAHSTTRTAPGNGSRSPSSHTGWPPGVERPKGLPRASGVGDGRPGPPRPQRQSLGVVDGPPRHTRLHPWYCAPTNSRCGFLTTLSDSDGQIPLELFRLSVVALRESLCLAPALGS